MATWRFSPWRRKLRDKAWAVPSSKPPKSGGASEGFRRLTLAVFTANQRAKEFYARQGWQAELETHYKKLS